MRLSNSPVISAVLAISLAACGDTSDQGATTEIDSKAPAELAKTEIAEPVTQQAEFDSDGRRIVYAGDLSCPELEKARVEAMKDDSRITLVFRPLDDTCINGRKVSQQELNEYYGVEPTPEQQAELEMLQNMNAQEMREYIRTHRQ